MRQRMQLQLEPSPGRHRRPFRAGRDAFLCVLVVLSALLAPPLSAEAVEAPSVDLAAARHPVAYLVNTAVEQQAELNRQASLPPPGDGKPTKEQLKQWKADAHKLAPGHKLIDLDQVPADARHRVKELIDQGHFVFHTTKHIELRSRNGTSIVRMASTPRTSALFWLEKDLKTEKFFEGLEEPVPAAGPSQAELDAALLAELSRVIGPVELRAGDSEEGITPEELAALRAKLAQTGSYLKTVPEDQKPEWYTDALLDVLIVAGKEELPDFVVNGNSPPAPPAPAGGPSVPPGTVPEGGLTVGTRIDTHVTKVDDPTPEPVPTGDGFINFPTLPTPLVGHPPGGEPLFTPTTQGPGFTINGTDGTVYRTEPDGRVETPTSTEGDFRAIQLPTTSHSPFTVNGEGEGLNVPTLAMTSDQSPNADFQGSEFSVNGVDTSDGQTARQGGGDGEAVVGDSFVINGTDTSNQPTGNGSGNTDTEPVPGNAFVINGLNNPTLDMSSSESPYAGVPIASDFSVNQVPTKKVEYTDNGDNDPIKKSGSGLGDALKVVGVVAGGTLVIVGGVALVVAASPAELAAGAVIGTGALVSMAGPALGDDGGSGIIDISANSGLNDSSDGGPQIVGGLDPLGGGQSQITGTGELDTPGWNEQQAELLRNPVRDPNFHDASEGIPPGQDRQGNQVIPADEFAVIAAQDTGNLLKNAVPETCDLYHPDACAADAENNAQLNLSTVGAVPAQLNAADAEAQRLAQRTDCGYGDPDACPTVGEDEQAAADWQARQDEEQRLAAEAAERDRETVASVVTGTPDENGIIHGEPIEKAPQPVGEDMVPVVLANTEEERLAQRTDCGYEDPNSCPTVGEDEQAAADWQAR